MTGTVYASLPLAGSDEISVELDSNGLLEGKRFLQGAPVSADVALAQHPCRYLGRRQKISSEEADHETGDCCLVYQYMCICVY